MAPSVYMSTTSALPAAITSEVAGLAQGDLGDWGEVIVFAVVVVASGLNGLIQAVRKKREARERERQMPSYPPGSRPPVDRPAPTRPRRVERQPAQVRRPVLLRPKPQPPRPKTVSPAPPTADVPPILETLVDAFRQANKEKAAQRRGVPGRVGARESARQTPPVRKPPAQPRPTVAERHVIEDRERLRGAMGDQRIGHVAEGVVTPPRDHYETESTRSAADWFGGIDLRRAMIVKEILGPPLALRDTDDYFRP